jgi:hypothetical protein
MQGIQMIAEPIVKATRNEAEERWAKPGWARSIDAAPVTSPAWTR